MALEDLGFASLGLTADDFSRPGIVVQLGRAPKRIDLLTGIDGAASSSAGRTAFWWTSAVIRFPSTVRT